MSTFRQSSFAAGEIAPALHARIDQARHAISLKTCRNGTIGRAGGFYNRSGTQFVGQVMGSDNAVKLVDFVYNVDQAYVLEFGNLTMRVIKNGEYVKLDEQPITGVTNANPAVVTYTGADTLTAGDQVYLSTFAGALGVYLNGRQFKVGTVNAGANTFQLLNLDGTNFDSTSLPAYTSGGQFEEIYTITTTYPYGAVPDLQWAQTADVLTITHPSYPPQDVARISDASWTISNTVREPEVTRPSSLAATGGGAGAETATYAVTAVDATSSEESLMGTSNSATISGITKANPAVVTYVGADIFHNGDRILITGVVGMTEVNGKEFVVAGLNTGANTFQLRDTDSSSYTAYSSGGTAYMLELVYANILTITPTNAITLTWTAVAGVLEYNVYKSINGVFGFIGVSRANSFIDIGYTPDTTDTPPIQYDPFSSSGNYPAVVNYIQQRRVFASTTNDPEVVWGSRTNRYTNFTRSYPIQADDSFKFRMAGRQVNPVRHLLDLRRLVIMTGAGEWTAEGSDGVLTPTDINLRQYSYSGASEVRPIVANGTAIYVQAQGSTVRDLGFEFESDSYRGNELTIYSQHLVEGFRLTEAAYQQNPHSIAWFVRDDGVLLGLTYVREQQMVAWHRHDFFGDSGVDIVTNVCVIPENGVDTLYLSLRRVINGVSVRTIERMVPREVDEDAPEDFAFMDCHLTYDGRNTEPAFTMTLQGADYTHGHTLGITASDPIFTSDDVGNEIHFPLGDTKIKARITAYTNSTQVLVLCDQDVPAELQNIATATWSRAVNTVTGLWHLEGCEVSVLGDGFVVGSPLNNATSSLFVATGQVLLGDECYAVIRVGLPYVSDLETLDIDSANAETVADKNKIFTKVSLHLEKTRGVWIGQQAPSDDETDPLEGLTEMKVRDAEGYVDPVALKTGPDTTIIEANWNSQGRVFVRQVDPLPMTVLAVMPSGSVPFRRGG